MTKDLKVHRSPRGWLATWGKFQHESDDAKEAVDRVSQKATEAREQRPAGKGGLGRVIIYE